MSSSISSASDPLVTTTGQPTANSNNSGNTSSSSLYLFTFLATVLVLILLSCGIVFRSILSRRRLRRRIEERIAAGYLDPYGELGGSFDGIFFARRQRDFGPKPGLYETWLEPAGEKGGEVDWATVQPVSVKIVSEGQDLEGQETKVCAGEEPGPTTAPRPPPRFLSVLRPSLRRQISPSSPTASPARLLSPNPTPMTEHSENPLDIAHREKEEKPSAAEDTTQTLEVAFLIAMPSPHRSSHVGGGLRAGTGERREETDLPDIVFGVAEVPVRVCGPVAVEGGGAPVPDDEKA